MNNQEEFFNFYKELLSEIERNTDHREKQIGDEARIWDGSANVDTKGKSRAGIDPLFKKRAIVSEIDCNFKLKIYHPEQRDEILDIQLYFPDDDIYVYTKSQFVQLKDFDNS